MTGPGFAQQNAPNRARRPWTADEEAALIEAYSGPLTIAVIARTMGRSVAAVKLRAKLLRADGRIVNRNPVVAEEIKAQAIAMCARRVPLQQVAEKLGVNHQSIINWRRAAGAKIREHKKLSPETEQRIRALRLERRRAPEIAESCGIGIWAVYRALNRLGFTGRMGRDQQGRAA